MAQAARATKPPPAPARRPRTLLPPHVPVRRKTPVPPAHAEGPAVRIGIPASPESGPKLKMPPAPTELSPAARQRIARTRSAAAKTASVQSTLPPAQDDVSEAQAHVTQPKEEPVAKQQQGVIEGIEKPSPEIEKLCNDIYDIIKGLRPKDEKELVHADPGAMAQKAGDKMQENVQGGIDQVNQSYAAIDQKPVTAEPEKGKDIPPPPNAAAAPPIQADQAKPDPIPPKNVSLDADVKDSQAQIDQAGMNSEPAKLVQEGPIADARAAQGDLQQAAREDPAKILAAQQAALDKAGADMAALQKAALQSLTSSRHSTTGNNRKHQEDMARTEHNDRATASANATRIFNKAKHDVDELINPLTKTAMDMWKAGVAKAKGDFEGALKGIDKDIAESHSGFTGWFRKKWHKWTGLPDWVTERYDDAEKKFGKAICDLAREISSKVNTIVASCQVIISDARRDIDDVFKAFEGQYPDWVAAEKAKFGKQLDALSNRASGVRDNFNKQLIQNATEAMQEVHDELEERREEAKGILGRIVDAIKEFVKDPIRAIINGLLSLLGIPKAAFWAVVEKIKKAISDIADDPLGFAKNLLKAVGQGFSLFFDHILKHLAEGFIDWFTGGLASAGVELPKDFSLGSIITFMLQLMGITWPRIHKLLVKHVGEQNMEMIENAWSMISTLIAMGPEGIFQWIKDKLDPQKILDQIVDMAVDYITSAVIKGVTARIIMLFNPVGAILQAIEAIYRVLKWIFVNAARIFKLIETVVDGIADILAGNIAGMAAAVERALVALIAPVIDFLADYFQFGDLPDKVRDTIIRFQTWVEGLLDQAIGWLVDKAKNSSVGRLIAGAKPGEKAGAEAGAKEGERNIDSDADVEGEHHTIRAHRGKDGVKILMASSQFKEFNDQLTGIEQRHLQHLKDEAGKQFSVDIGKIREDAGRIESDANKAKEKPGMSADAAASAAQAADRVATMGIIDLKQQLAKLGPKYAAAEAANLKSGDAVMILEQTPFPVRVDEVGIMRGTLLGIKVSLPPPSKDRILAYTEYGTKWRKPLPGEKATLRPAVGASTYNGGSKTRSILAGVPLNENPTNPADVPGINQIYNVRGHLIANTFGGPNSRASRNIVAITETANKQMKRVEDSIRLGYLKKPATESFVIRYEVTPDPDKSPPQTISLSATREWPEPKGVAIPLPTNSIDNVP